MYKFGMTTDIEYYGYIELGNKLVNAVGKDHKYRVNRSLLGGIVNGIVVFDEI